MSGNKNLAKAKMAKKDEFYTQLTDIEKELRHYRKHFQNKVILCNCDDPYESNFFKYFALNFNLLGIKRLIATSYVKSIAGEQLSLFDIEGLKPEGKEPFKIEINEVPDHNKDGAIDLSDVELLLKNDENSTTPLKGDGSFDSDECIDLLKSVDIVVTNPPFSMFAEYVSLLVKYNKKFLIIGHQNALTYKEIFPLIKNSKLWLGFNHFDNSKFQIPMEYNTDSKYIEIIDGKLYGRVSGLRWYTNLDHDKRHESLILYKKYDKDEYPKYENYNAINVRKVADIPLDYEGAMGVPITFLDSFNPEQFEIIGTGDSKYNLPDMNTLGSDFIEKYKSQGGTGHYSANMWGLALIDNGKCSIPYKRLIIKRK